MTAGTAFWPRGRAGALRPAQTGMGSLAAVAFALLVVFVAAPIVLVLAKGFLAADGTLTLAHYRRFLDSPRHLASIRNSLLLGLATTLLLTIIGFAFAFALTRGPRRLRTPLRGIALLPLIAPHYIFGISLIILGGRQGIVTQALGLESWTVYGWSGVILSQVLSFLPIAVIMIENVLRGLDSHLEDAARDLGAREIEVLRRVTLPLCAPGLLKAALLVFSLSIADFANPALLGANLSFLAPNAYQIIMGEMNMALGSVPCALLVLPCAAVFLIHHSWLKDKSFTTVGGRPVGTEPRPIPPLLNALILALCGVVAALIVANFAVTAFGAVTVLAGVDNSLTLRHFLNREGVAALLTSLKVSLLVGLISTVAGNGLAYVLVRGRMIGRGTIEFLALAGFALPGTVLGIGYLMAFNAPPLPLTNGLAILVLVTVFHVLAVPLELGCSRLVQIAPDLEEAAADLGAGAWVAYRRIILPLMAASFLNGFVYAFLYSMVSVSAPILLISPGRILASVYIFQMADLGLLGTACAVTVAMIGCVLLGFGALHVLDGARRRLWRGA
ncbi:MAG: ABC transporter permease subunit [Rhodospirillales bacterium]|nr:ABC transporter permease subunit [Rhodospirillales bacterium]